ncbi:AraC family transcriptional regulator [Kocuria sp. JC486]|uniref:AraC family transcriptional regulator n=1 Tax=Kocuria soli TaxID=2485125 RepID=A0A3N3ZNV1_9MICC|nr:MULTISPECIES: GyrI-like domain-containing protein [Kocuria]NHU84495.1 AraC family transcriptional regulator [Kocuria sp. JC486]ROZ62601.1 AraC family transcriptional regulator [Kocuria soli]
MNTSVAPEPFDGVVVIDAVATPTVVAREQDLPMTPEAMSGFYDATFRSIFPALDAQGIQPVGPAFGLHTRMPSETVDIEAGVPVDRVPQELPDELVASELPAGKVVATTYIGGYDGLGEAWGAFMQAVVESGHTPTFPLWEVYVTEPSPEGDPAAMRTDLFTRVED